MLSALRQSPLATNKLKIEKKKDQKVQFPANTLQRGTTC